jgi:phosphoribosyl 1,2-cyclic phosphodiesterase
MSGFDSPETNSHADPGNVLSVNSCNDQFVVRFWGVRGCVPTPSLEMVRYGGNTACVELNVAGKRLIFDGGTGLRLLGKQLLDEMPVEAHIFFTHTHWDRIQGFPFFSPAFIEGNTFHIYGAVGLNGASIKQRLYDQMLRPHFPVPLQVMQSNLSFHNISPGSVITIDDVTIETVSLNRPNRALGYRVTWNGHSVVYATDAEPHGEELDRNILYLADQADVLIYDTDYPEQLYCDIPVATVQHHDAWHSGVDVAIAAGVKRLIMFHHDPAHEDDFLDKVEAQVKTRFPNVLLAREGMGVDVLKSEPAKSLI